MFVFKEIDSFSRMFRLHVSHCFSLFLQIPLPGREHMDTVSFDNISKGNAAENRILNMRRGSFNSKQAGCCYEAVLSSDSAHACGENASLLFPAVFFCFFLKAAAFLVL